MRQLPAGGGSVQLPSTLLERDCSRVCACLPDLHSGRGFFRDGSGCNYSPVLVNSFVGPRARLQAPGDPLTVKARGCASASEHAAEEEPGAGRGSRRPPLGLPRLALGAAAGSERGCGELRPETPPPTWF